VAVVKFWHASYGVFLCVARFSLVDVLMVTTFRFAVGNSSLPWTLSGVSFEGVAATVGPYGSEDGISLRFPQTAWD
jgi:hypothetical protein